MNHVYKKYDDKGRWIQTAKIIRLLSGQYAFLTKFTFEEQYVLNINMLFLTMRIMR